MMRSWNVGRLFVTLIMAVFVMACFCNSEDEKEPSRWDNTTKPNVKVAPATDTKAEAPAKTPVADDVKPLGGSSFNAMFPADGTEGATRVFTQEKEGYAEAKFTKDELEVVISISDTAGKETAADKFEQASDKVQGFPLITRGKNGSMVLVKDRVQVKVTSKTLGPDERKAWLEKVNLSDLANLVK